MGIPEDTLYISPCLNISPALEHVLRQRKSSVAGCGLPAVSSEDISLCLMPFQCLSLVNRRRREGSRQTSLRRESHHCTVPLLIVKHMIKSRELKMGCFFFRAHRLKGIREFLNSLVLVCFYCFPFCPFFYFSDGELLERRSK